MQKHGMQEGSQAIAELAQKLQDDASCIGFHNGEPYPKKWPNSRNPPQDWMLSCEKQSLQEAFLAWPKVLKEELQKHIDSLEGTKVLASTDRGLKVSSHWSGICTSSRGAAVLQNAGIVRCKFDHVQNSEMSPKSGVGSLDCNPDPMS